MRQKVKIEPDYGHHKLVSICFNLVLTATDPKCRFFRGKTNEQKAAWVAEQLDACGIKTTPMGASWGHLDSIEYYQ